MIAAPDTDRARLEVEKARSTVQLLFKAARLLNERAIGRVRERTGKPLRVSHTALLPHLDLAGTRLTVLAERLGVSKQAAGQLVDDLEEMGFVERAPDRADARAKLVRFSKRGQKSLFEGLAVLGELEVELRAIAGAAKLRVVHDVLAALVAAEEARRET